jgi:hypothetical protein
MSDEKPTAWLELSRGKVSAVRTIDGIDTPSGLYRFAKKTLVFPGDFIRFLKRHDGAQTVVALEVNGEQRATVYVKTNKGRK